MDLLDRSSLAGPVSDSELRPAISRGDLHRAFPGASSTSEGTWAPSDQRGKNASSARADAACADGSMSAKDEFMAMLAHELRNPLSAITAAVNVMDSARDDPEKVERARSVIARQAQNLSRLVDDLLDVGRVITGKIHLERRPLDLCDLVRRTVAVFFEREADRQIELATGSVWVEGDPVRVEQIVSNIVGNAVKYTASGGRIRVSLMAEGSEAVLRVKDNGFGITSDLLPAIFDLFVQGERTLDRAQGGLGIGLTLVRRLVDLHHGTVSATSAGAGNGCTFTVRLPRIDCPRGAGAHRFVEPRHICRRRVLIIEDNRDAREMLRMMLELAGHEVVEAEDGCLGLEMLRSSSPDVAFVDVGLPGIDGYEIARKFRNGGGPPIPLIALTGYGTPDAFDRSREAGFNHHMVKPVDPDQLQQLLATTPARHTPFPDG